MEITGKERLENLKAHKIVKEKMYIQNKYKDLAEKAIENPKTFAYHFTVQQAAFVVSLYYSMMRSPFIAVQDGLKEWVNNVSNPKGKNYLYVIFKNNKLEVDLFRIKRDYDKKL